MKSISFDEVEWCVIEMTGLRRLELPVEGNVYDARDWFNVVDSLRL